MKLGFGGFNVSGTDRRTGSVLRRCSSNADCGADLAVVAVQVHPHDGLPERRVGALDTVVVTVLLEAQGIQTLEERGSEG